MAGCSGSLGDHECASEQSLGEQDDDLRCNEGEERFHEEYLQVVERCPMEPTTRT
jgi:hypothetical protein